MKKPVLRKCMPCFDICPFWEHSPSLKSLAIALFINKGENTGLGIRKWDHINWILKWTVPNFRTVSISSFAWCSYCSIWRRYLCRWKAANFDLCSALIWPLIEQWWFFSVPHRLQHGVSAYNGHLRGRVTIKPNAERFSLEMSLPVLMT